MMRYGFPAKQDGAALIVAMILLLLLTLMGTDSMRTSALDIHLGKGFHDQDYAFQSAETGLRLAEQVLQNASTIAEVETLLGNINIGYETGTMDYRDSSYWDNLSNVQNNVEHSVKVVVEKWSFVRDSLSAGSGEPTGIQYYRITSRGVDPSYQRHLESKSEDYSEARSLVLVQSVYAARHVN